MGMSDAGFPLHLVIVANNGDYNFDNIRKNNKRVILVNNGIHPGEPDGIDASIELSKRIMKSNGRLVCVEATFLARQTRLSRWIVSKDRGRHVRLEQEWKNLISQAFDSYSTCILTGLTRIPYTHIVMECANERSSNYYRRQAPKC